MQDVRNKMLFFGPMCTRIDIQKSLTSTWLLTWFGQPFKSVTLHCICISYKTVRIVSDVITVWVYSDDGWVYLKHVELYAEISSTFWQNRFDRIVLLIIPVSSTCFSKIGSTSADIIKVWMYSWWWMRVSSDTRRAVYRNTISPVYSRILLDNYWHWFTTHGPMNMTLNLHSHIHMSSPMINSRTDFTSPPIRITCPAHLILLNFITLITYDEEC